MFSFTKYKKRFLEMKDQFEELWNIASDQADDLKRAYTEIRELKEELAKSKVGKKVAKKVAKKATAKKTTAKRK